jgi:hypothetical protein
VDINLSSDDEAEHPPMPDALADQKLPADDDAEDEGVASIEPTALHPIRSNVLKKIQPSAANQALVVPPSGKHRQKCLHTATRRSNPVPSAD